MRPPLKKRYVICGVVDDWGAHVMGEATSLEEAGRLIRQYAEANGGSVSAFEEYENGLQWACEAHNLWASRIVGRRLDAFEITAVVADLPLVILP